MDTNQFEWDVIQKRSTFWVSTLKRSIVLLPLFAAASYGSYYLAYNQVYMKRDEVHIILELLVMAIFIIINYLWHRISLSFPIKLIHFKISDQGIDCDKKKYSLLSLNGSVVDEVIKKKSLPYQEWRQPRPADGNPLQLNIPSQQGEIKLLFSEEYVRQKFLRTLYEYLHPTKLPNEAN